MGTYSDQEFFGYFFSGLALKNYSTSRELNKRRRPPPLLSFVGADENADIFGRGSHFGGKKEVFDHPKFGIACLKPDLICFLPAEYNFFPSLPFALPGWGQDHLRGRRLQVAHFAGGSKPWGVHRDQRDGLVKLWWSIRRKQCEEEGLWNSSATNKKCFLDCEAIENESV